MSRTFTFRATVDTALFGVIGAATRPNGTSIVLRQDHTFGDSDVFRSTDGGVTWTGIVSLGWDGTGWMLYNNGHWLAGSYNAPTTTYYSADDGLTWNGVTNASGCGTPGAAGDGANTIVMPGNGGGGSKTVYSLNNGTSTAASASLANYFAPADNAVLWDGTQFVGIGLDSGLSNRYIFTAPDFSSGTPVWTQVAGPSVVPVAQNGSCSKFAHDPTLGYLLSGTTNIGGAATWYTSTVLANLLSSAAITPMGVTGGSALMSCACNGVFFIGDSAGNLWESTDGVTWSQDVTNFAHGDYATWVTFDPVHHVFILFGSQGSVCNAPAGTNIPNVVGLTQIAATLAITSAGFTLGPITSTYSATVAPGLVALQLPVAGTLADPGTPVAITLSLGSPEVVVPDVIGMTAALAESTIAGAQLVTGAISGILDPDISIGSVGTQNPLPGTIVFAGTPVDLGISFIVPEFDVDATVISQYANSPTILAMVANFAEYFDPAQNLQSFYLDVWNIDTAIGFGLDIWGRILGVSRVIPIPGTSGAFGFENSDTPPDWENFGNLNDVLSGGPFFSGQISGNSYKLNDGPYRTLLLTKALGNICATTAPALNALITNLFPGRGRCYTRDGGAMTMTYVFEFPLTTIEYAILAYSGVLAHPAGVGVNINVAAGGFLGFAEALPGVEPFNFGVFFGA
jgi:Protein of unknown function (DUF2612)/PASTA domain